MLCTFSFIIDTFVRTAVLSKLFDTRFSYKHCNFSRVCLLVKMASKTVARSIVCGTRLLLPSSGVVKVVLRGIYGNLDFSLDPCTMDGKQPLVIKRTHFTKASMLKHQSTNRGHYFYFSYTHGTVILPGHRSQAKFQPLRGQRHFL